MREALFILIILLGLLAWTIFRYRKQILAVIGFGRMIRDVAAGKVPQQDKIGAAKTGPIQLAKCSACGINVPTDSLRRIGDGSLICDRH
jgi:hypothetical protein